MPVLYPVTFLLLSVIAGVICLAVPRLRPHLLAASLGPVAFGFWAAIGTMVWMVVGNRYGMLDGRWYLFSDAGASLILFFQHRLDVEQRLPYRSGILQRPAGTAPYAFLESCGTRSR